MNQINTEENTEKNGNQIKWKEEHELILVEWGDKALCYKWLHSRSNAFFTKINAWITIPIIILSTLTGTANFAFNRYPDEIKSIASLIIGSLSLFTGILSTIQQFLQIRELNESHRMSAILWDKFYRNIKVELAKSPDERINAYHMLKICKEEYDRLMETSPIIKQRIIKEFKITFLDNNSLNGLRLPEICDELIPTDAYRHTWYKDKNIEVTNEIINEKKNINIKRKSFEINEYNEKLISTFRQQFYDLYNRNPLDSEIFDNLEDRIDNNIISKIIDKNKYKNENDNENENNNDNDIQQKSNITNDKTISKKRSSLNDNILSKRSNPNDNTLPKRSSITNDYTLPKRSSIINNIDIDNNNNILHKNYSVNKLNNLVNSDASTKIQNIITNRRSSHRESIVNMKHSKKINSSNSFLKKNSIVPDYNLNEHDIYASNNISPIEMNDEYSKSCNNIIVNNTATETKNYKESKSYREKERGKERSRERSRERERSRTIESEIEESYGEL